MALTGLDISKFGPELTNVWAVINAITWDNRRGCAGQVTATGTNQATAYQLAGPPAYLEVTNTASGTGVNLDLSSTGDRITVVNNGLQTLTIYTSPQEVTMNPNGVNKINGTAGASGVTQTAGTSAIYFCATPGQWYRISGS